MKRLVRGEKGYILIAALLVLVVVGLISGPVLSYMVSGLKAGHVFETGAAELYAADAGVQDAVWRIPNLGLCPSQNTEHYTISDVNGKSVDVTVTLTNNVTGTLTYKITSIAVTDAGGNTAGLGSHTTVESYVQFTPGGELDIFSGVLSSKGDIEFKGPCSTIEGSIYVGGAISGCYEQDPPDFTPVTEDNFPTPAQDLAFAQALKAEATAGGTHTGDMKVDSTITLESMYITGDLIIDSGFTLGGIVYVKGGIHVNKDITINGSGSSIALIAEGDIYFQKVSTTGNTGDLIIMSLSSYGIEFRKEATLSALIYAPNGQVWFKKTATVEGSIIGASIRVENDASLTYVQKASGFDLPGELPGAYTIETYDVSRLS